MEIWPNSSARSSQYWINERSGARPQPPEINSKSWPCSPGRSKGVPNGPRMPRVSPAFIWCMAPVRLPACRTPSSNTPPRVGDDATEIGASPQPSRETWTNCPGRCPSGRPSFRLTRNSFSAGVRSETEIISHSNGRYRECWLGVSVTVSSSTATLPY